MGRSVSQYRFKFHVKSVVDFAINLETTPDIIIAQDTDWIMEVVFSD